MGLFKRSKEPEGPLPSLSVHLSTPEGTIFHPDDIVTGHISFSTPVPLTPQALEVNFWGMSTVWLRTSHSTGSGNNSSRHYHHYRDNAPLFKVSINVLDTVPPSSQPPHLSSITASSDEQKGASSQHQQNDIYHGGMRFIQDQTYTFPFQFRFPAGTSSNRTGFYKSDSEAPWTVHPHALPPTMLRCSVPSNGKEHPNHAFIEYGITSRLICPGIGTGKKRQDPISSTALINFTPRNPFDPNTAFSMVKHPKTFTIATSALAGIDPQAIGFRQSLRDKFSSSTPSLTFELAAEMPDLLTSGTEFRFRTSFTALEQSGNVVKIPGLVFRILKLQLLVFTFARAPRDWAASNMMSGWHHDGTPTSTPNGLYKPDGGQMTEVSEDKVLLNTLPELQTVELEVISVSGGYGDDAKKKSDPIDEALPGYDILDNKKGSTVDHEKKVSLSSSPERTDLGGHEGKGKGKEKEKPSSTAPTPQYHQQTKTCEAWFAARVPSTTPPNFVSFAITRAYRLKAKVALEVAGKKVEMDGESVVNALSSGL